MNSTKYNRKHWNRIPELRQFLQTMDTFNLNMKLKSEPSEMKSCNIKEYFESIMIILLLGLGTKNCQRAENGHKVFLLTFYLGN